MSPAERNISGLGSGRRAKGTITAASGSNRKRKKRTQRSRSTPSDSETTMPQGHATFVTEDPTKKFMGRVQKNLPGYNKESDWNVPGTQRSRRPDQPSSSGRQHPSRSNPTAVSPQDSSISIFSATGPPTTQSQPSRSPRGSPSQHRRTRLTAEHNVNTEAPTSPFDPARSGFTDPRMSGPPAVGGFPGLHTAGQIQDPYGPGYPSSTDMHQAQGLAGRAMGVRCNDHANIPVYHIRSLGCGCRLACSGDGNVIAVLEEGAETISSSMMASPGRGQGDFHPAHTTGHSQWTGGQSSSGSGYPGNSMEPWSYNYPSS